MQEAGLDNHDGKIERRVMVWRYRAFMAWAIVGCCLLLYVLGVVLNVLAIPVGILIWTGIIVFCLRGQVDRLEERGMSRLGGTVVAYIGMIVVVAVVVFIMGSPILGINDQFKSLIDSVPNYMQQVSNFNDSLYQNYPDVMQNPTVNQYLSEVSTSLASGIESLIKNGANSLIGLGTVAANMFMCIGFAVVVAFWLLSALPGIHREVKRLFGGSYAADLHFLHVTITRVMGGYIKGTLLQCVIIALGCMIAFSIIGVPNAVAFGLIAGILNIIPVVGPWLGGAAAAVAALLAGPWVALLAFVSTIIIQQFVYSFISPKIMANSVDVHPVLVIMAMMVGGAVGWAMSGIVGSLTGMLLSIPLVAVGKAVFVYYFEKKTGRHLVAADGVFFRGVPSTGDVPDPEHDATSPHPRMLKERLKADARTAARKATGAAEKARRAESRVLHDLKDDDADEEEK